MTMGLARFNWLIQSCSSFNLKQSNFYHFLNIKKIFRQLSLHSRNCQCSSQGNLNQQNTMSSNKIKIANRLTGTESNVWVEFGKLAVEHKALNIGQGFADFFPPSYVTNALKQVANTSDNFFIHQYTRSYGHPRLVNALAKTYSNFFNGKEIDPMSNILITVGAYGSLFCCHQGLINQGDEVIIIEPFFDCYDPMVRQAGGIPVFVPLKTNKEPGQPTTTSDWTFDKEELESKFNQKTKAIVFNNPNNPLGKVYTLEEMEFIADLCKKFDVIVFSDEVYEHLVYPPTILYRMANLPGMWDRTITIGSAGKSFSVTGWKMGWSIGPEHLIHALSVMHQNCIYTCPTPIQEALALCFEEELNCMNKELSYFKMLPLELLPKRNKIVKMLDELGMNPIVPEGGYFIVADFSKLKFVQDPDNSESKDYQFVKWMCKNKKLAAIPNSAFYGQEHKKLSENLVRFCFMKQDSTLEKAAQIIHKWNKD